MKRIVQVLPRRSGLNVNDLFHCKRIALQLNGWHQAVAAAGAQSVALSSCMTSLGVIFWIIMWPLFFPKMEILRKERLNVKGVQTAIWTGFETCQAIHVKLIINFHELKWIRFGCRRIVPFEVEPWNGNFPIMN